MARDRTAALIVIGNEILSGKIADTNSHFLARALRAVGVTLRRILVIPDEVDLIAECVRECGPAYDVVFTSGGVGPTHDDVTVAGVAAGLGRHVVRHPGLVKSMEQFFEAGGKEALLKMAEVVEGTELVFEGSVHFPVFHVDNFYLLPGIPEIFEEKIEAIRERFAVDPFHLRVVYVGEYESKIAGLLQRTLDEFPDLLLGSYPSLSNPEYRVRVTLESKDVAYLDRAFETLMNLLPPSAVVRTEGEEV